MGERSVGKKQHVKGGGGKSGKRGKEGDVLNGEGKGSRNLGEKRKVGRRPHTCEGGDKRVGGKALSGIHGSKKEEAQQKQKRGEGKRRRGSKTGKQSQAALDHGGRRGGVRPTRKRRDRRSEENFIKLKHSNEEGTGGRGHRVVDNAWKMGKASSQQGLPRKKEQK